MCSRPTRTTSITSGARARCRSNVSAEDSRLEEPLERARLRKVFSQGLDKVIGQVLPLARTAKGDQWQSGRWYLRDEHCRLVPGDSPLGYRLPLGSQPWVKAAEYPFIHPQDPNQDFPELPDTAQFNSHGAPADGGRARAENR